MIFAYLFMPHIGTEIGPGSRSQELTGNAFSPEPKTITSEGFNFWEDNKCSN